MGIIYLCFADALLLFSRGYTMSVKLLNEAFQKFSATTGLKENMTKSQAYFGGVPCSVKAEILEVLGFIEGEFPIKYLGVPLSTRKQSMDL